MRIFLTIIIMITLSGCGTISSGTPFISYNRCGGFIYSGIVQNIKTIRYEDSSISPIAIIDMPFSLIADTLILPFTIPTGLDSAKCKTRKENEIKLLVQNFYDNLNSIQQSVNEDLRNKEYFDARSTLWKYRELDNPELNRLRNRLELESETHSLLEKINGELFMQNYSHDTKYFIRLIELHPDNEKYKTLFREYGLKAAAFYEQQKKEKLRIEKAKIQHKKDLALDKKMKEKYCQPDGTYPDIVKYVKSKLQSPAYFREELTYFRHHERGILVHMKFSHLDNNGNERGNYVRGIIDQNLNLDVYDFELNRKPIRTYGDLKRTN